MRPCVRSRNLKNDEAQTRKGCECQIEEESEHQNLSINEVKGDYRIFTLHALRLFHIFSLSVAVATFCSDNEML